MSQLLLPIGANCPSQLFAECSTSHNAIGYGKNLIASGRNLDTCQVAGRPGDCNPEVCGGIGRFVCESRIADTPESICGLFGVPYFGCRSYSALSSSAQIIIRKWTLSRKERQSRYQSRLKIMPLSPANRFKGERYNVSNSSRRVGAIQRQFIPTKTGTINYY
uniref:Uncharacterized protein n=1 Tax=Ditylenchus dipsaci TaxID=166011 RepID=A0A915EB88_9BILA